MLISIRKSDKEANAQLDAFAKIGNHKVSLHPPAREPINHYAHNLIRNDSDPFFMASAHLPG